MGITISFELPTEIEQALLGRNSADFGEEAKEGFLVDLYRQDRITHHQLAEALGLEPQRDGWSPQETQNPDGSRHGRRTVG